MQKRLYRSKRDKIIGGVAGGLGEYFDIDPVIIRIIFVVTGLMGGSGILAYIICWIIIPQETSAAATTAEAPVPAAESSVPRTEGEPQYPRSRNVLPGLILIVLGGLFLANNLLPYFHFRDYWPIILIAIGVGILLKSSSRK
ncbi:MAG: PspC domain-containing protein [Ignavibacteria bacterium]|nr:PspC domain-containing protein [Ignavibacteria bacterium]